MQRAAAITDQAIAQFPHIARPGLTEKQIAWELEKVMFEAGADGPAFATSVASGPNSARPHHTTSQRLLQKGDVVIVDMGARLDGYHSDLTRTFYLGSEPPDQFWQLFKLVQQAQQTVLQQTRPGMTLRQVDAIARSIIHGAGHTEHFGHGLGHGVGLEIHEDPFLSPHAPKEALLAAGTNITIEPGVYIPDWGGIRLEDFTFLTEKGLVCLSQAPQEPLIADFD
jgi:Xaa-Pro aminopeptidase